MATSQRQAMWFRCRRCAYLDIGEYDHGGQWYTSFPPCRTCGLQRGKVDVVDADIELDRDGRRMLPYFASPFLTSRFGKGTERIHFEDPRHLWELSRDGPIANAIFRCRRCGSEKRGTYSGQWKSEFPLCSGQYCGDGGMVDCLEWHGADLRFLPPHDCLFLSSRFGPGTEVLPVERGPRRSVREMRLNREEWRRDRSRSPRQERLQYPSARAYRDDQRQTGAREASHHHLYGVSEEGARIGMRGVPYRHQHGVHGDYALSTRLDTPHPHGYGRYSDQVESRIRPAKPAFGHSNVRSSSDFPRPPRYPSQEGYEDRSGSVHTPASWATTNLHSNVQSRSHIGSDAYHSHRPVANSRNLLPRAPSHSVNTFLPSRSPARRDVRSRKEHGEREDTTQGSRPAVRTNPRRKKTQINPSARSDPDAYCLLCHGTGHQVHDCEGPEPERKDVGIARWIPDDFMEFFSWSTDRPSTARQLITLLALCEYVPSQKTLFVEQRDSLLLELHDEMCIYPKEIDHAAWIRFMSEINIMVRKGHAGLMALPRTAVKESLSGHFLEGESFGAFVTRVFADNGDFTISREEAEAAKGIVDKVRILFEDSKEKYVDQLQRYLTESAAYQALDEMDRDWMLRAFTALVDLQPSFETDRAYICPFVLPNTDEVVADLGLWSREIQDCGEIDMEGTEARPQEPGHQEVEDTKDQKGLAQAGVPNTDSIKVEEDMYADVHIKAEPS